MHLYIFVYTVTKCNMRNLSAFVQVLYIKERTYPHPISERIFESRPIVLFALFTLKYTCLSNSLLSCSASGLYINSKPDLEFPRLSPKRIRKVSFSRGLSVYDCPTPRPRPSTGSKTTSNSETSSETVRQDTAAAESDDEQMTDHSFPYLMLQRLQ